MHVSIQQPQLCGQLSRSCAAAGAATAALTSCPLVDESRSRDMLRMRYNAAGLFAAGGGESGSPPPSTGRFPFSLRSTSTAVEAPAPTLDAGISSSSGSGVPTVREADVPQIMTFNGQTVMFGDYRKPSLAERAVITIAGVFPVAWQAVRMFRGMRRNWAKGTVVVVAPVLAWLLRSVLAYFYKQTILQPKLRTPEEAAFPNSRIEEIDGLQVHTLRENPNPCGTSPKTILHLNHGFGASSISWSLVIQQLSQALNAVTVAHDAPGFGLTGRPGLWQAAQYSLGNNAAITRQLVKVAEREIDASSAVQDPPSSTKYILMGHSMGCITAATVSLDSTLPPRDTMVVLIAPALTSPSRTGDGGGGGGSSSRNGAEEAESEVSTNKDEFDGAEGEEIAFRGGGGAGGAVSKAGRGLRGAARAVVGVPANGLRAVGSAAKSLVYRGNFWRAGLRLAWFDKAGVDLDAINRYRWPSLVRLWDRGMALFLLERAQIGRGGASGPPGLVEAVAAKAAQGMKVILIQGEEDKIVNLNTVRTKIFDSIPGAKLVVMPSCGHVPHEEQPEEFLRLVLEELGEGGGWTVVENDRVAIGEVGHRAPPQ